MENEQQLGRPVDDEEDEPNPWQEKDLLMLLKKGELVQQSFAEYLHRIETLQSDDDYDHKWIEDIYKSLVAFSDVHFDLTGIYPQFGHVLDGFVDEEDMEPERLSNVDAPVISIRSRKDFIIQDGQQVIDQANSTCEMPPHSSIAHLGQAIYQIRHQLGDTALENVDGMTIAYNADWYVSTEGVPPVDDDELNASGKPLAVAETEEVLYSTLDVFMYE